MLDKFLNAALLVWTSSLLVACVTINIYFPAAAAEKAADEIIEEVWQLDHSAEDEQKTDKSDPDG